MSWEQSTRNKIVTGKNYRIYNIGIVKVIGNISQFGGDGSGGGLFVECEIVKTEDTENYPLGSTHELNAEFMYPC